MQKQLILILILILHTHAQIVRGEDEINIIPTPQNVELKAGIYTLKPIMTVAVAGPSSDLIHAAEYLIEILRKGTGYKYDIIGTKECADIILEIKNVNSEIPGSYLLDISDNNIIIQANNYNGIISGISSLRQLLPVEIERVFDKNAYVVWEIPQVTITDAPRFQYRGLMLDVARHFFDKKDILKLLDRMALYKLNKFHWHLTDDEGWRIEINKYPELTTLGAWRTPNILTPFVEQKIMWDDRSDFDLPLQFVRKINGELKYGGYFTKNDIREIVKYAKKLGIDIIPEIDMPGHSKTATSIYPWLSCESTQENPSKTFCLGKDAVIRYCKNIYKEVLDLFPYEYVHLGADEVNKTNWSNCPMCQKRIRELGLKDEKGLQSWFVHTMESFFTEHGKKMIGWEEISEGGLSETSTIMWWQGNDSTLLSVAKHGNHIISTPNTWAYFDHQPFWRTPFNGDIQTLYEGDPIPDALPIEFHSQILGGQGNIWCEYITSTDRIEYMSLPKMFCLSEICWIEPNNKNWVRFSNRIEKHISRLDAMNTNYYVPFMESSIFNTTRYSDWMNIPSLEYPIDTILLTSEPKIVEIEKPYPNITIRYTIDGTMPNLYSPEFISPMEINTPSEYIWATFRPNGTRGEIRKTVFVKSDFKKSLCLGGDFETGFHVTQYDFSGNDCLNIDKGTKLKEYFCSRIAIPQDMQNQKIALVFSSHFYAHVDSVYTFSLHSNGGTQLYLGDKLLIDSNGQNYSYSEKVAQIALCKGYHSFELRYFCRPKETFVLVQKPILELKSKDRKGQITEFPIKSFKYRKL